MKYAIIKVINGNYFVHAEGITDLSAAKTQYHQVCSALWNEPEVLTATVIIVDESLDIEDGHREFISHFAD